MTKKRTTALLAELKQLAAEASKNPYRRVVLADTILQDAAWIARHFDGNDNKALDALEDDYFRDIGKIYKLGVLRAVLRRFPTEAEWAEVHYDITALVILWESERPKEKGEPQSRVSRADLEEAEEKLRDAERENRSYREREIELRQRIKELEEENQRLRGRIDELERISQLQLRA
jgi:hypothetical protein